MGEQFHDHRHGSRLGPAGEVELGSAEMSEQRGAGLARPTRRKGWGRAGSRAGASSWARCPHCGIRFAPSAIERVLRHDRSGHGRHGSIATSSSSHRPPGCAPDPLVDPAMHRGGHVRLGRTSVPGGSDRARPPWTPRGVSWCGPCRSRTTTAPGRPPARLPPPSA